MRIRIAALLALAAVLLWADGASADGPLTLEGRTASSLTVSWSWSGQTASGWALDWRARGDDETAAWRGVRKTAAHRRHTISGLDAGTFYIIRIRALDLNDRILAALQGTFPTHSAATVNLPLDPRLLHGLAERFTLDLSSSRELCTAGTLTEISWQISGGKPPYKLQIEGSPANADAETIRINCGALTEAEAADEDAALTAKRIIAVVTDARGARREAAIKVARARPLPAPPAIPLIAYRNDIVSGWTVDTSKPNGATSHFLARWRPTGTTAWTYELLEHTHYLDHAMHVNIVGLRKGVEYRFEFASLRDRIESETPNALIWIDRTTTTLASPTGLSATATHDTVTVTWDEQPSVSFFYVLLDDLSGARPRVSDGEIYDPDDHSDGTPTVVFRNVPPDREYTVRVQLGESPEPLLASTTVRTLPAPPGWTAPPRGAQNVRTATTSNSITVTWDAPYPDAANDDYRLMLFHPTRSGIRHERVYNGVTSYTFDNLEPGLTYRVVVDHVAIVERDVELEVTTKSRSTAPSVTPVLPRDR